MSNQSAFLLGGFKVMTTEGRGWTPEEIAERALDKIIYVGNNSHPAITQQAQAFRENIRHVLLHYLKEAVQQDRSTIAIKLQEAGHPELVKLLD
jgi:hypothetical protein